MIKTFKYEIYLNKSKKKLINNIFKATYYVYNLLLYSKKITLKTTRKVLSLNSDIRFLNILYMFFPSLKKIDRSILLSTIFELNESFELYIKGKTKMPKYKKNNRARKSFRLLDANNKIKRYNSSFFVDNIGKIKTRKKLEHEGNIISASFTSESSGKFFLNLVCECNIINKYPKTNKLIGLDMGIKSFVVTDKGDKIVNYRYFEKELVKYSKLQKELSSKVKGSANWYKVRKKIARLSLKIKNQRKDFLHKLSTHMVKNYDIICIESINLRELIKKRKNKKDIYNLAWAEFVKMLEYKAKWHDKKLIKIDRWYPSSQICSFCGIQNHRIKNPTIKKWKCVNCNTVHDRDINAAKNILNKGLTNLYSKVYY